MLGVAGVQSIPAAGGGLLPGAVGLPAQQPKMAALRDELMLSWSTPNTVHQPDQMASPAPPGPGSAALGGSVKLWRRCSQAGGTGQTSADAIPAAAAGGAVAPPGPGSASSDGLVQPLSGRSVAELLHVLPLDANAQLRAVDVGVPTSALPGIPSDLKVALGLANGRIRIVNFPVSSGSPAGEQISSLSNTATLYKELSPKYLRLVNDLSWNSAPGQDHLLAAGYDKMRQDAGLLIFDVTREATVATVTTSLSRFSLSNREEKSEFVRATTEIGQGEACQSLSWLPGNQSNTLLAGMNGKSLKVFDLRVANPEKNALSTFTRAVHGVCVDPFLDSRLASTTDNSVVIWDTRNFEKPIVTLNQPSQVLQLQWCPNRAGLLCSATAGSDSLTLHDIQSWATNSELEPAVTERTVKSWKSGVSNMSSAGLSSFSWLPDHSCLMVGITWEGALTELEVTERLSPSWGGNHCLVWPYGGKLQILDSESSLFNVVDDVSPLMQKRAGTTSYGNCHRLKDNGNHLVQAAPSVASAWAWLSDCGQLMSDLAFRNRFSKHITFPGVRSALGIDKPPEEQMNVLRADIRYATWNHGDLSEHTKKRKLFRNDSRESAQKLCGWSRDDLDLAAFVKKCEEDGNYSRAAAVSIFCLDLRLALRILERGAANYVGSNPAMAAQLTMTSMSLAGYSEDKHGLWRDMVRSSTDKLEDPYLRAMFAFLLAENDDYSQVLSEPIRIYDKVSFQCLYLDDEALFQSLNETWHKLLFEADLEGLFLCGMSEEGLELFQRYIDFTGDVQTVSWLVVRGLPATLGQQHPIVTEWIECYRDLLDSWELYHARADFDTAMYSSRVIGDKRPSQVYVSCNYCGSSVAQHLKGLPSKEEARTASLGRNMNAARSQGNAHRPLYTIVRVQSCPACKKPLPRCAICLVTMGSHSGLLLTGRDPPAHSEAAHPVSDFFSWCQTCRHGGHAGHLALWFEQNDSCPLSGCNCKCWSVDPVALVNKQQDTQEPELPTGLSITTPKHLVHPLEPPQNTPAILPEKQQ